MNKENYKKKLTEIASMLYNEKFKEESISLLGGKSGVALFLAYFAKYSDSQKYLDKALELIESSFDDINNGDINASYSSGIAGFGWTIEHLVKYDFIEANTDEMLSPIDEYIFNWQNENLAKGKFDYLHNGLGGSMYLLSRNTKGKQYLNDVPKLLLNNAEINTETNEIIWRSKIGLDGERFGSNFGLAHGIPSIIGVLTKFLKKGVDTDTTLTLLKGATNYVKNNCLSAEFQSAFPYCIVEGEKASSTRLAWCYGDLGVAISLFMASNVLGDTRLRDFSIDVLKRSCERKNLAENGVVDVGLCHGTAGNAHMYNRMFIETGETVFKDAATYWFEKTLDMASFEDGLAGFKRYHIQEDKVSWENSTGLLEGIAGIGLALISFVSDIEPAWDESLLMS